MERDTEMIFKQRQNIDFKGDKTGRRIQGGSPATLLSKYVVGYKDTYVFLHLL